MEKPCDGMRDKRGPSPLQYFSVIGPHGAIPELDGLRGIAILLVLGRHAVHPIYEQYGELLPIGSWDIAYPLLNGWMGVDLFFVLSGFLISHHLLKRGPDKFNVGYLGRYWLKRVLRTFPAYFATLLLVLSGVLVFYDLPIPVDEPALIYHFTFMQDYTRGSFVPAFWSLGVEEKFYLLCPLILLAIHSLPLQKKLTVTVVLLFLPIVLRLITLLSLAEDQLSYPDFFWTARAPFHLASDGLLCGVACGLLYHHNPDLLTRYSRWKNQLFYAGLATAAAVLLPAPWFDSGRWYSAITVVACVSMACGLIVLAVLMGETPLSRFLRMRWLRFFSVISYSLYLVHMLFVPLAEKWAETLPGFYTDSTPLQFLLFLSVFLLLSTSAALLLHYTIEKPFLLLKDRL